MDLNIVNLDTLVGLDIAAESFSYKQGICQTMCPKHEIELREREGLLHVFEISKNNIKNKKRPEADRHRIVKQFSRPAAGQAPVSPDNLRPFPVLKATVKYLYESIVPLERPAWSVVYAFVFDRLRAVRQDMIIQGITGQEAILLLEQVVRFHLYAAYRLRAAPIRDFDPVINKQHLLECLKRLLYLYQVTPGVHEHREEFECVYLLDNLGDVHAMTHCLNLHPGLRRKPLLSVCFEMNTSFLRGNYRGCLRLAQKLDTVSVLCALQPQLDNLRVNLLQLLSVAFHIKNSAAFPVDKLKHQLALVAQGDVLDLCARCSLIDLFSGSEVVRFDKTKFRRPQQSQTTSYEGDWFVLELENRLAQSSLAHLLMYGQASKLSAALHAEELLPTTQQETKQTDGGVQSSEHEGNLSSNCINPDETKCVFRHELTRSSSSELGRFPVSEQDEAKLTKDFGKITFSESQENVKVQSGRILKDARLFFVHSERDAKIVNKHGEANCELMSNRGEDKIQSVKNIEEVKSPRKGRGHNKNRKPGEQTDVFRTPSGKGRGRGRGRRQESS